MLSGLSGAGAWLTAPLVQDGREIESSLFTVSIKRRLRLPIFEADTPCPMCGQCMDSFADHALVCPCKGDRTIRHNCLRDITYSEAKNAALRAEKEKPGLLPPRPKEDGLAASTSSCGFLRASISRIERPPWILQLLLECERTRGGWQCMTPLPCLTGTKTLKNRTR